MFDLTFVSLEVTEKLMVDEFDHIQVIEGYYR